MDVSSEMIHALLPIYLVTVLGTSAVTVGVIEGLAEATAAITKVFSGAISDWLGKRKLLVLIGYGLAAFTKPVFPMAPSIDWLIGARFIDRIGKGIRGAPRDALIADIAPEHLRSASFGLRQSLDTIGAFIGPLLAISLMIITANSFKVVFWIAVIPAFLAVGLIVFGVKEPERPVTSKKAKFPLQPHIIAQLPSAFWVIVAVSAVFTLARFSEAFLLLKAQAVGVPIAFVPAVLVVMNLIYALVAFPIGVFAEGKARRNFLLIGGLILLISADVVLAFASHLGMVAIGVALWGLHMGFTQGLLATLIADAAPPQLRGTAFGIFNLVSGVALLVASVLAGALWDGFGAQITFLAGAGFSTLALIGFIVVLARQPSADPN